MAINKEIQTQILRLHFVEKWGVHTIASHLKVHHTTVDRVLSHAGMPRAERAPRPSILDDYLPFILETLQQYPRLSAARIYGMAQERGYQGGPSLFRHRISELRPRKAPEAFLRLKTLPGEQGQMDWGHFGHIDIGKAKRPVMAFVIVLSWCRQIFLRFYLNQKMESFLHGHVSAFEFFGGLPRVILFDNLKSAVLARKGDAIRLNPELLDLSAHYRFEPRPVAVARGNEKGRVERSIRYIRDNFFAGRKWQTLEELNALAHAWCVGHSANRRCPNNDEITVREAFEIERAKLIPLPDNPFPVATQVQVPVGKTPYIRFDLNDYSIPHTHVQKVLTVSTTPSHVRVLDGVDMIAEHTRHYGKGEQIEKEEHLQDLLKSKSHARYHRGQDRLSHAAPSSRQFLEQSTTRGNSLPSLVSALVDMLADYGSEELEAGISEALQNGVPHPNAVRQVLESRREKRDQPPPLAVTFKHEKANRISVRSGSLDAYDHLGLQEEKPSEQKTQKPENNIIMASTIETEIKPEIKTTEQEIS